MQGFERNSPFLEREATNKLAASYS